jgi:hypothetical protein
VFFGTGKYNLPLAGHPQVPPQEFPMLLAQPIAFILVSSWASDDIAPVDYSLD